MLKVFFFACGEVTTSFPTVVATIFCVCIGLLSTVLRVLSMYTRAFNRAQLCQIICQGVTHVRDSELTVLFPGPSGSTGGLPWGHS